MPMQEKWENNILGFVPKDDWLNVGFNVTRQNDPTDVLLSDTKTDNIMAKWQSLASEFQIPMMAQFHGFDTESQKTFRVPVDTHNVEKGLIKVKINQSERMRELIRSGVREDALYDYIINDGVRLAEQVFTRSKVAKNELLATGKVTIKENNLDLTVDYGVPTDQLNLTLDFSENAYKDIPAQLQDIIDRAQVERGVTITGIYTSKYIITKLRNNTAIQKAINGNIGVGALVRNQQLKDYLSDEFGINVIITNDLTYGASAEMGTDGRPVIKSERYYPKDRITFFAINPGGKLGTGLWGNPPEIDAAKFYNVSTEPSVSPYVYVMQWMETDPTVLWTKASGLFMPVLFDPNSIFVATVDDDSLDDITVQPEDQTNSLFDVPVSTIQKADVAVLGNKEISGTSKYMGTGNAITDNWGAGNFIAVKFGATDWNKYTSVKVGLEPSAGAGLQEITTDPDKNGVFKVADPKTQKLVIVATNGVHTDKQTIDLSGVTLQGAGA